MHLLHYIYFNIFYNIILFFKVTLYKISLLSLNVNLHQMTIITVLLKSQSNYISISISSSTTRLLLKLFSYVSLNLFSNLKLSYIGSDTFPKPQW